MKYVIITLALTLGACSSSKKSSEGTAPVAKPTSAATKQDSTKKADAKKDAKTAAASDDSVTCSYGEVKRQISISVNGENCSVEYTKDGSVNEIATGSAGGSFCKEVQERVKNNLASAGYTCE